jgi:hypothetical protein
MPIELTIQSERGRVVAVGRGTITADDFEDYIAERVRLRVQDYKQVLDLREATLQLPRSTGLYSVMVRARRALGIESQVPRTATVAIPGTATFGLVRQQAIQDNLQGHEFEVFDSLDAADDWLG